jgi:hypothetical protein
MAAWRRFDRLRINRHIEAGFFHRRADRDFSVARHEIDLVAHHRVSKRTAGDREHLSLEWANGNSTRESFDRGRPRAGRENDPLRLDASAATRA